MVEPWTGGCSDAEAPINNRGRKRGLLLVSISTWRWDLRRDTDCCGLPSLCQLAKLNRGWARDVNFKLSQTFSTG